MMRRVRPTGFGALVGGHSSAAGQPPAAGSLHGLHQLLQRQRRRCPQQPHQQQPCSTALHQAAGRSSLRQQVACAAGRAATREAGASEPTAQEQAAMDRDAADLAAALASVYEVMPADDDGDALSAAATDRGAAADGAGKAGRKPGAKAERVGRRSRAGRSPEKELPIDSLPKVAVVGRPNVGKSALFNRVTGSATAIVYDFPGVTRDRLYTRANWGDREFVVVDTGGLMSEAAKLPEAQQSAAMRAISDHELPQAIERQAAAGIAEAAALILVVDGQMGVTSSDEEVVSWLRKTHPKKPVVLAVNKCENTSKADEQAADFWALGHAPIAVSAISGTGTGDLMDALMEVLPPPKDVEEQDIDKSAIAVAIVGRPNVGKSSLVNAITGKERSIVSNMRGTTRDAIDTDITQPDGRAFKLIDTAGIRRRTAVAGSPDGAEGLSVDRAFRAIRRADVVGLVIDAVDGVTQQDFRLAERISAEGRACVLIVNKWDAIEDKNTNTLDKFKEDLLAQLRPVAWARVVFTSAVTGQRLAKVLDAVADVGEQHRRRVTTATLNLVVREAVGWRSPPSLRGDPRKGRVYYATQAATRPPTYVFFVNEAKLFNEDYRLYMERQLRENIGLDGTPVRVYWRNRKNNSGGAPRGEVSVQRR